MTDRPELAAECSTFCRYLVGVAPPDSVQRHYARFHAEKPDATGPRSRFDALLLGVGRLGGPALRLADAYAGRFLRDAALRRRMVVALALLECTPPTCRRVDDPGPRGTVPAFAALAARGALFGLLLVVGVVLLGPFHAVLSLGGAPRGPR